MAHRRHAVGDNQRWYVIFPARKGVAVYRRKGVREGYVRHLQTDIKGKIPDFLDAFLYSETCQAAAVLERMRRYDLQASRNRQR